MFIDLLGLNGVEKIDNFFPRYLINPVIAFKYDNKIFHSIDYDTPRYCDLNVTYITSNYYVFQKLRKLYNIKFLPYSRVIQLNFLDEFKLLKNEVKKESDFLSGDYYSFKKSYIKFKSNERINNVKTLCKNFHNYIYINYFSNNCLNIPIILFCLILSNNTILTNKIFIETIDNFTIKDLSFWLNCDLQNENIINSKSLNCNKLNKIININKNYIYNYILNDTKQISTNMSYLDFLNSDIK